MLDLILETALPDGDIKALYEWQQNTHKPLLAQLAAKDKEIERLQTELDAWNKMTLEVATMIADNADV